MFYISFFLACRYMRGCYAHTIRTMFAVCFVAIALASCALALATFIMQGFEQSTHKILKGIHTDLIMHANAQHINFSSIQKVIENEFPQIVGCSPGDLQQGLICSKHIETPTVVTIKIIDPILERKTTMLEQMMLAPQKSLVHSVANKHILVGTKLAEALGVRVGDTVKLLIPAEQQLHKNRLFFEMHQFTIGGICKTGIEEFDASIVVADFFDLQSIIAGLGVSTVHLKLCTTTDETEITKKLRKRFGMTVQSWKDLYPALVAALKLETCASIAVLSLMVLLASITIVALLFMLIAAKQKDMAILQAMGLSSTYCSIIFVIIGVIISSSASLLGLVMAATLGWLLKICPIIQLPDAYYVSQLPIAINFWVLSSIFLLIFVVTLGASLVPFVLSKRLPLAQSLKAEN